MYHTCAFYGNLGPVTNTQLPALADGILQIQNNAFMLPNDLLLLESYLGSVTMSRGYISSPKIVQLNPLYIRPVTVALEPGNDPNISWHGPMFPRLRGQEGVSVYFTNTPAAAEHVFSILHLSPNVEPVPAGEIYTVYATSTTAAVAVTWTQIPYTFAQNLPAGQYAVVGSEIQSASGVAHRWTFDNQFWRPGHLSQLLLSNKPAFTEQFYQKGLMGQFQSYSPPRLEVLCNAADAAHDIYLRLIKVA